MTGLGTLSQWNLTQEPHLDADTPSLLACVEETARTLVSGSEAALVRLAAIAKYHRLAYKQKCTLSHFWRLEIQSLSVNMAVFLALDGCLLTVSSPGKARNRVLWGLSIQGPNPIPRTLISWPPLTLIISQRPPSPNIIQWG